MENFCGIIELLNVLVWPAVVLIIFFILRKPITKIFNEIRGVKYGDASIYLGRPADQKITMDESKEKGVASGEIEIPFAKSFDRFSEHTKERCENIVKASVSYDKLDTDKKKMDALLAYGKFAVLYLGMFRIYNFIYGSQIRILQKLNADGQVKKEDVRYLYDGAKEVWPNLYNSYSFDQYINFLSVNGLIIINPEETITISNYGQDFLRFIIEDNLSIEKAY